MRALYSFRSSKTRFLPRSMKASNLTVNSAMRRRRSSKGMSAVGSWVSGLSEYEMGANCDCDWEARSDEVDVEKADGARAAIFEVVTD